MLTNAQRIAHFHSLLQSYQAMSPEELHTAMIKAIPEDVWDCGLIPSDPQDVNYMFAVHLHYEIANEEQMGQMLAVMEHHHQDVSIHEEYGVDASDNKKLLLDVFRLNAEHMDTPLDEHPAYAAAIKLGWIEI